MSRQRRTAAAPAQGGALFTTDILPRKNTSEQKKERTKQLFLIRQAEQAALATPPGQRTVAEPWFLPYRPNTPHKAEINALLRLLYNSWEQVPFFKLYESQWRQVFSLTVAITSLVLSDNGVAKPRVRVDTKTKIPGVLAECLPSGEVVFYKAAFQNGPADLADSIFHESAHSIIRPGLHAPHNAAWHDKAVELGMPPGYSTRGGKLCPPKCGCGRK